MLLKLWYDFSTGIIGLFSRFGKIKTLPPEHIQLAKILHWQHVTMYTVLIMLGVTKVLCFTISSLPMSLIKLMASNAFFVEGKYVGGGLFVSPALASFCTYF